MEEKAAEADKALKAEMEASAQQSGPQFTGNDEFAELGDIGDIM